MKNRSLLTKLILLFTFLLAHSVAQAQSPLSLYLYIDYRPVGITLGQSVRFNFVSIGQDPGIVLNWRFLEKLCEEKQPSATP